MPIKTRIVMATAALTLVAGLGAGGMLTANAATPQCGTQCADLFSRFFGTPDHPAFILDVLDQVARTGQPVVLDRASGTNPGEDFAPEAPDPLVDYYQAGLAAAGLAQRYGCTPGVVFTTCPAGAVFDYALEFQYAPDGAPTGYCLGVGTTPGSGAPVTPVALEPCGVNSRTLWVVNLEKTSSGTSTPYFELISAATDSDFDHPYTLSVVPYQLSPVVTTPLATTFGGTVPSSQQWGADTGAYPFSTALP
jgi:hypothetical protein